MYIPIASDTVTVIQGIKLENITSVPSKFLVMYILEVNKRHQEYDEKLQRCYVDQR